MLQDFSKGYVHSITGSVTLVPNEKLGIVRTKIHYVTLHFRDRESAASIRLRNRPKSPFLS